MKSMLMIGCLLAMLYSCKKDQLPLEPVCLLDTIYKEDGFEVQLYNSSNKVIKVIWLGNTWSYIQNISYDGRLMTVTVEGEPGKQQIWLNAFGYADSSFSNIGTQGQTAYRFKYNEKQQLVEQHSYGYFSEFEWYTQSYFEYVNGNLIRKYIPRDIDTFYTEYFYDLTKENSLHSYEQTLHILPTNKNLLTGFTHSDGTEKTYTFKFDTDGKVVKRISENEDGLFSEERFIWSYR